MLLQEWSASKEVLRNSIVVSYFDLITRGLPMLPSTLTRVWRASQCADVILIINLSVIGKMFGILAG